MPNSNTNKFSVFDLTKNTGPTTTVGTPGAVQATNLAQQALVNQYVSGTPDTVSVTALVSNVFIRTGAGNDLLNVSFLSGDNVLDAGAGTNALILGSGHDAIQMLGKDLKIPAVDVLTGFHPGDVATIWGIAPGSFTETQGNGAVRLDVKSGAGVELGMVINGYGANSVHTSFGADATYGNFVNIWVT